MKYREEVETAKPYKEQYLRGIENIIKSRRKEAEAARSEYIGDIFTNPEKYRSDLRQLLGWPLVDYNDDRSVAVRSELLSAEDGYEIYRMQFEILDGLNLTGLFFKQSGQGQKPLIIAQHGGLGTPELVSGVYGGTSNYNDMLHRIRSNGVHVFAPQLLLWNKIYGEEFDRQHIDGLLKRVGSSITAIEVYGITKILDYFEGEDYVSAFGMAGMSYGGFYSLYTAALDERIKSVLSCSFFNTRDAVCRSDWAWNESAKKFDDAEVACLIYPRKLCIEMGNKDELFDYRHSEDSFDRIKELCAKVGTDWVELRVFDGNHEFCKDDEPVHNLVKHISAM